MVMNPHEPSSLVVVLAMIDHEPSCSDDDYGHEATMYLLTVNNCLLIGTTHFI